MIGFGIKTNASIFKKAEQQKSTLKTYNIIYQITDFLEEVAQGMLEIKTEEYTAGKLEVLGVFFHKGKDMVIGGRILNGIANPEDKFRVIRNDEII